MVRRLPKYPTSLFTCIQTQTGELKASALPVQAQDITIRINILKMDIFRKYQVMGLQVWSSLIINTRCVLKKMHKINMIKSVAGNTEIEKRPVTKILQPSTT